MPPKTRSVASTSEETDIRIGEIIEKKLESFKKELTFVIIQELKKEIREETQELMKDQENKIVKLESTISMLQNHVLKHQSAENVKRSEELEQYGRRLCLRFDGIPTVKNEKAPDVLVNIKKNWEENELIQKKWEDEGLTMPGTVIDRAHRIGRLYIDREKNVECQSVIMRLTTFRHRTQLYKVRKLMENISVKLDLTKHRYQILKEARRIIEGIDEVEYVYADINCRLKVKMGDDTIPFNTVVDLKALIIKHNLSISNE